MGYPAAGVGVGVGVGGGGRAINRAERDLNNPRPAGAEPGLISAAPEGWGEWGRKTPSDTSPPELKWHPFLLWGLGWWGGSPEGDPGGEVDPGVLPRIV